MARSSWIGKLVAGAAVAVGAAWAFDKYARTKHQRSGMSLAVKKTFEIYPQRNAQQEIAWLDTRKGSERQDAGLQGVVLKSGIATVYDDGNDAETDTYGMTTYRFSPKDYSNTIAPNTTILFVHGGSYVGSISPLHVAFISHMTKQYGVDVLLPDYDPAPYGTAQDAYRQITALYTNFRALNPHQKVIVMGDSSGAGLALGLALDWAKKGIQAPEGIVAICPWLDTRLDNPEIEEYKALDPMNNADALRIDAHEWAGSWDDSDYRISPITGNLKDLKNSQVTLLVGTDEIFYPDTTEFAALLSEAGVHTKLHIGENMTHDYPLQPIPEAKEPLNQIEMAIIEAIIQ
ncbi:alpha/beta hydrolase fold domain-containing protein [Alloscardovia criceti]|uniref:alpha/beta hydrolase fold domain-containing protein n=1 Tax=Alloscardovia criceti TaxID=356828 RepID=UPI00037B7613|nr:alpha/beta hydrolase [Alloscardovia criceti]